MKKHILLSALIFIGTTALSQEALTLSGGVATARAVDYSTSYNIDYDTEAVGFRITGTYEVGPLVPKKLLHGFSLGYILTNSTVNLPNLKGDIKIRTLPMYYAPKFMLGSEKIAAFVRGALGVQFGRYKFEGDEDDTDNDWGFYGGVGLGGMVSLNKRLFLNLEYEWAYMSNTFYANGIMNSLQVGIGFNINMGPDNN